MLTKLLEANRKPTGSQSRQTSDDDTLFPGLVAACRRGVKVIAALPGWVDPNDGTNAPASQQLSAAVRRGLIDRLTAPHNGNLAIWRLSNVTVHAKVILIDDEFLCVGSANAMDRPLEYTLLGDDSELSVAAVSAGSLVADLRVRLWAEHLRVGTAAALAEIRDLGRSPGVWRPCWGSGLTVPRPASPLAFGGPAGSHIPTAARESSSRG
jgi:phosphatidylserine/phosphatidylglycerophosphate/cardiolipin synthase-like enzyme